MRQALITLLRLAEVVAFANITVGSQRAHFAAVEHNHVAQAPIHAVEAVVLHFENVHVIDDRILPRDFALQLIVVQDHHLETALADIGNEIRGQCAAQPVVVEVQDTQRVGHVTIHGPIQRNGPGQVVKAEIQIVQIAEVHVGGNRAVEVVSVKTDVFCKTQQTNKFRASQENEALC